MQAEQIHQPCPDCGSSDALTINSDGSKKCYSCDVFTPSSNNKRKEERVVTMDSKEIPLYYKGDFRALKDRGISLETAKRYGVKKDEKGNSIFPLYNEQGDIVASKVRKNNAKSFAFTGNKRAAMLFGMNLFAAGSGKYLTVVEGQEDCLAAYEMLGSKWPVISVHSASGAKSDVKRYIDYFESFTNVVFIFDADEPGRKAATECAELLSPGKAKVVTLTRYKDANDYLKAKQSATFQQEFWNAKLFSKIGVVTLSEAWSEFETMLDAKIIEIPDYWGEAKRMLRGGFATGEITTITADTSVGKTTQLLNLFKGVLELDKERNITALLLEDTLGRIVSRVLRMELGIDLDVGVDASPEERDRARELFEDIEWTKRLHIINHTGTFTSTDELIKKLRNTAVATSSDLIMVDPLQQATPDTEHQTIRSFMDELLKLGQQLDAAVVQTSHIKNRQRGGAYDIVEDDAIGSSAIKQVTYTQILLSRDKMAKDETVKNSTKIDIPKCRRTGMTGEAGWMKYVPETGNLVASVDPREFEDEME